MRTQGRVTAPTARKVALIAMAALIPALVPAQQTLAPVRVGVPSESGNNARADTIEARAEALYPHVHRWQAAARLQRQAGAIRGDDPRAVRNLRMAAWLYGGIEDFGSARTMMEHAAERATTVGDLEQAAVSYIDAAFIAIADDQPGRVPKLLRKTRLLLDAPLFPADARTELLQRIEGVPQLAAMWGAPR